MTFGAIAGFAIIIVYLILYFLNFQKNYFSEIIIYIVLISIIVIGTKQYKNTVLSGNISYGKALGTGTVISLFASIIVAFYMFIFLKFIDSDSIAKILSAMEDNMYQQGLPENQIDESIETIKKFTTPFTMTISTVLTYTFLGFLFSLITSAFLKKKSNGFNAAMAEIEKEKTEEENK